MALEILQILASGTFGHVAVVRDTTTGSLLAAKMLKGEHVENVKIVRRLQDEAELLARLDHPAIVRVVEIREVHGRPVLLMEWIRGAPLDSLLVRMPEGLPPAETCEMIRITTEALWSAWNTVDPRTRQPMRVIHRDLKPSNLLLSVDGDVKVVDFGIAKGSFVGKQSETVSVVLGAHGYLAPERLDGAEDTPAGDVYALGCVMFELLTARRMKLSLHPTAHVERMKKEMMKIRPPGTTAWTIHELTELVGAMCAYDPSERPDHAQVIEWLGRVVTSTGWTPDLPRMARKHVVPVLAERTLDYAGKHTAYQELQLLEEPTGHTPTPPPLRRADEQMRSFLAEEGWQLRLDSLRRQLAVDPSWTAAPLLEHLERLTAGPFWKRWRTDREERDQLVAVLELLRARPGALVAERVRPLLRHRDPEVAQLAREITGG